MQNAGTSPQSAAPGAEDLPAVGSQAFFAHRAADAPANLPPDAREARARRHFLVDDLRDEVRGSPSRSLLVAVMLGVLCGSLL